MWCIGGDPASHLGWIKEILTTGETPLSLFYPIVHIYISEWVYVSGLDIIILHKIVPFIFEAFSVLINPYVPIESEAGFMSSSLF